MRGHACSAPLILILAMCIAVESGGCGDEGGDNVNAVDASAQMDGASSVDAAVDADPDAGGVQCLPIQTGPPDVLVSLQSGVPPTLAGGAPDDGDYTLVSIATFADSTFTGLVSSAELYSVGNSYGSAAVLAGQWAFELNLDAFISLLVLGSPVEYPLAWLLNAGGDSVDGNQLVPESVCLIGWPTGDPAPSGFEFEAGGDTLSVLVTLSQAAHIAMLPPENQATGSIIIAGDLRILLTFTRP